MEKIKKLTHKGFLFCLTLRIICSIILILTANMNIENDLVIFCFACFWITTIILYLLFQPIVGIIGIIFNFKQKKISKENDKELIKWSILSISLILISLILSFIFTEFFFDMPIF